jgi:hypothetical protein
MHRGSVLISFDSKNESSDSLKRVNTPVQAVQAFVEQKVRRLLCVLTKLTTQNKKHGRPTMLLVKASSHPRATKPIT